MKKIPRGVWMLGLVSLFMDLSSEMIHALLPLFVTGTLGASAAVLGLLEGVAEAIAQVMKLFSGYFSDRWRSRKIPALVGYGLAALVKPMFPLAGSVAAVFAARCIDRVGKGIRGSPRDAMVADMTPKDMLGAAFGLRQSLDTIGAFAAPLVAMGLLAFYANNIRLVFWIACIPAFICVAILAFGVEEPEMKGVGKRKPAFDLATVKALGRGFWMVTMLAAAVTLARFSEAFLVLKASAAGMSITYVPLVMVVMAGVYTLSSYPAGVMSDTLGRRGLLGAGLAVLIAADLILGFTSGVATMLVGVALWGLHMGLTQGILSTLVADTAPPEFRGTAFGMFNLVCGAATLVASLGAGLLWDRGGPAYTFAAGAMLALVALLALQGVKPGHREA
jgi:MFS family permease